MAGWRRLAGRVGSGRIAPGRGGSCRAGSGRFGSGRFGLRRGWIVAGPGRLLCHIEMNTGPGGQRWPGSRRTGAGVQAGRALLADLAQIVQLIN